jgi:hypothetical protein
MQPLNLIAQATNDNTVDIRSQMTNGPYSVAAPGGQALGSIISNIISVVIIIAALALLMYLIIAGFNWLTAGGDSKKVEDARSRITNGLIGLAIVASIFAIFRIVDRFFGIGLTGQTTGQGFTPIQCGNTLNCYGTCVSNVCYPNN